MIGARMLHNVEKRCSCIFPNNTEDFGGLFVHMFGDFRQLPPVKDKALYDAIIFDEASSKGALIFESFQYVIELSVSYRWNNDQVPSDVLDRIVYGETIDDDYNMLSTRRFNILDWQEQEKFHNAMYICPTNNEVKLKNEEYLRKLNKPVLKIQARVVPFAYCDRLLASNVVRPMHHWELLELLYFMTTSYLRNHRFSY